MTSPVPSNMNLKPRDVEDVLKKIKMKKKKHTSILATASGDPKAWPKVVALEQQKDRTAGDPTDKREHDAYPAGPVGKVADLPGGGVDRQDQSPQSSNQLAQHSNATADSNGVLPSSKANILKPELDQEGSAPTNLPSVDEGEDANASVCCMRLFTVSFY